MTCYKPSFQNVGDIMDTSPDLLQSVEMPEKKEQACSATQAIHRAAGSNRWEQKACAFVVGVAKVLKVAREELVPEIDALAVRLLLLGLLFYHIAAFLFRRR
jgi:hypothetical protein